MRVGFLTLEEASTHVSCSRQLQEPAPTWGPSHEDRQLVVTVGFDLPETFTSSTCRQFITRIAFNMLDSLKALGAGRSEARTVAVKIRPVATSTS